MEPAASQVRSVSFDAEALGQPQRWVVHHRGLEYIGEVIVAEAVDLSWARPLEGRTSFRIVFLTVPRRLGRTQIDDTRIAMAVPRRFPESVRTLGRELRAIHEARERYITARDRDAVALRDTMEEREASLREEVTRRYGMSYSQGRIYTHPDIEVRSRDVFFEESPSAWADRLASSVLLMAHPSLPFDHVSFPDALTGTRVADIHRGLFQRDEEALETVRAFGPGLGLTRSESADRFEVSACKVFSIIEAELGSRDGEASAQAMLSVLTRGHGLTVPLAALYLMAFVRHSNAELELVAGHGVESRTGPLPGVRITGDLVSEVVFSESLPEQVGTLRLKPSTAWDAALPYAALLVEDLAPVTDSAEAVGQIRRLLERLGEMALGIAGTKGVLSELEDGLGPTPLDGEQTLERLQALCDVSGYEEFYSVARESFEGPSGLAEALDSYARMQQVTALAPAIAGTSSYLNRMTFGRDDQKLSLERDAVAARLDLAGLLANPSLWSSVEASFQRLEAGYSDAYLSHHARYRQQALELSHRLEELRPQIEALARFNAMPELGEPLGTDVPQMLEDVAASLKVCGDGYDRPSLEEVPYCEGCGLRLDEDIPRRDVELLVEATSRAMREYNRRLGSHGVRQVLAHPTREQLDKFIGLLEVADPSALANVLDDDVVEFLRQFLGSR